MKKDNIIKIITDTSKEKSREAGIKMKDNTILIMFPHGFRFKKDPKGINRDIINLIRLFEKYNKRKKVNISEENFNYNIGKNDSSFPFTSTIWLINDYQRLGFITMDERNTEYTGRGRISWSKTMKKVLPVEVNEDTIYNEYITVLNQNTDTILTDIHKYCVSRSLSILGWLFQGITVEKEFSLPKTVSACINILKKEMNRNNNDRTKMLINHMLKLLMHDNGSDLSDLFFMNLYTDNFEYVWEDMIFYCLNNVDIKEYYPRAFWEIGENRIRTSHIRPDTILRNSNVTIIIDAKYYTYGYTTNSSNLPQSSDIIKQIAYNDFLKQEKPANYKNCFVLPKNVTSNTFEYFGYAGFLGEESSKVLGVFADTSSMIEIYLNSKTNDLHVELIEELAKYLLI